MSQYVQRIIHPATEIIGIVDLEPVVNIYTGYVRLSSQLANLQLSRHRSYVKPPEPVGGKKDNVLSYI